MSLPPEIGVAQNMIRLPPRQPRGMSEVVTGPFQGCMAVAAVILLRICYGGYKLAHWTHEMALNRVVNAARPILSTKPIAVVVIESLAEGHPNHAVVRNYKEKQAISIVQMQRPTNPVASSPELREEVLEVRAGDHTRYLIRKISENLKPIYDDQFNVVKYEHDGFSDSYEYRFVFAGNDVLRQVNNWLEQNNRTVYGLGLSTFDPLESIDRLKPGSPIAEFDSRNVIVNAYYRSGASIYCDSDCMTFSKLNDDEISYLSNLGIK